MELRLMTSAFIQNIWSVEKPLKGLQCGKTTKNLYPRFLKLLSQWRVDNVHKFGCFWKWRTHCLLGWSQHTHSGGCKTILHKYLSCNNNYMFAYTFICISHICFTLIVKFGVCSKCLPLCHPPRFFLHIQRVIEVLGATATPISCHSSKRLNSHPF